MKEMEVLTMTRTELKVVLKLHHDWKVNYRRDYAMLLMVYTEGKILSMFEAVIAGPINFLHKHHIYEYSIDWHAVYIEAARQMHELAMEAANAEVQ